MQNNDHHSVEKLKRLQEQYPVLRFTNTIVENQGKDSFVRFCYKLDEIPFETTYKIPLRINLSDRIITLLLKYLGIVEAFSYWKLTCSPLIIIENQEITEPEARFFKKLLLNGMSEFLFRNELPLDISVEFKSNQIYEESKVKNTPSLDLASGALVLVGGGKDSVVSLETMRFLERSPNFKKIIPFCVNPIKASIDCIDHSGFNEARYATRIIDKKLHELNSADYFNGHIPFSAVLSFISSIVARSLNLKYVISSNEVSANQGNTIVNGVSVNHQYSKSIEYENDLSELFDDNKIPVEYFSLLRPLNEIQISQVFSKFKKYHAVFQSCNIQQTLKARQKNKEKGNLTAIDRWCGRCPKCVFVYLMLNLFLKKEELRGIFGEDLSQLEGFTETVKKLSDPHEVKPFECVGTFEEVAFALKYHNAKNTLNLEQEKKEFLSFWNTVHRVPIEFEKALKKQLTPMP